MNWDPNGDYKALSAKNVKTGKLINIDSVNKGNKELYNLWMKVEEDIDLK